MSIVFLIALEKNPYSGVVRPFINWAKTLKDRATVAVYGCSSNLEKYVSDTADLMGFRFIADKNFQGLVMKIKDDPVDYLISDDYVPRLKLLLEASGEIEAISRIDHIKRETSVKTAVYVQVLHGIHSISRVFSLDGLGLSEKIRFKVSSLVPFRFVTRNYLRLLGGQDIIIANSKLTAGFLHNIYGVETNGVVYPPIDTEVFKSKSTKKCDEVLVYLGSHGGDTDQELLNGICEVILQENHKVLILGNYGLASNLISKFKGKGISWLNGVSDEGLAEAYSRCKLTVCPQEWETFGYVPIESILCGTPVLALALLPFSELLQDEDIAYLVYSRKAFLEKLKELLRDMDRLRLIKQKCFQRREALLNNVSQTHSTDRLLSILNDGQYRGKIFS